jgi:uncharacterized membrane protein
MSGRKEGGNMKPTTWQTVLIVALVISPFWLLASRIDDLDELVKSGIGVTLAGVAALIFKFLGGKHDDKHDDR